MKKATLHIFLLVFAVISLASCTRNHGDIGPWFGTWYVEQITADGTRVHDVEGNYFFQFQSKVFRVSRVYGLNQMEESFGTWQENDGKMTISFPDPSAFYIHMPGLEEHNDFSVTTTSSSQMTLTKTDAAGTVMAYYLKKQP